MQASTDDQDNAHTNEDETQTREWDADSALGSDEVGDSTQSLASSILDYRYENGRRYHAFRAGQYFMPNDAQEQEGMDLMHHVSQLILQGDFYYAPITNPRNILEIGTGTGLWAIDVADKFPEAEVIATDLSPIQPRWVPPNLQFEVDDCESSWSWRQPFDFIHMRNLSGAIADWPQLLRQCYENLRPGGWIEVSNIEAWGQSYNNLLPAESASYEWQNNLKAAATAFGRELNIGPQLEQLLIDAGFRSVMDHKHMIPMSRWMSDYRDKELSIFFQHLVSNELEAMSLRLYTGVLGWAPERLQALLVHVRREIKNPDYQMFSTMHYVIGRKPST